MFKDSLHSSLTTLLEDISDSDTKDNRNISNESSNNESCLQPQSTSSAMSDSSLDRYGRQTSSIMSNDFAPRFTQSNIPPLELASRDSTSVDDPDDPYKGTIDIDFRSETGQPFPETTFDETKDEGKFSPEHSLIKRWNHHSKQLRNCREQVHGESQRFDRNIKAAIAYGDKRNTSNWITFGNETIARNLPSKSYVTQKKDYITANKMLSGRNSTKSLFGYSLQFQQKPSGSKLCYPTQSEGFRLLPCRQWPIHHSAPSTSKKPKRGTLSPSSWLQSDPLQYRTQMEKQRRQQGYADHLRFRTLHKAASTPNVSQTTTTVNDAFTSKHCSHHGEQSTPSQCRSKKAVKNKQTEEENLENACSKLSDGTFATLTETVKQNGSSMNDGQVKSNRSGSISRRDPIINLLDPPESAEDVEKSKALQKRETMLQYSLKVRDRLVRQIQKQRESRQGQVEPQEQCSENTFSVKHEQNDKSIPYFEGHIEELLRRHEEDRQRVAAIQSTLKFPL